MASRREQIVAAVAAALNTGRPGGIPEARREPLNPSGSLPAIRVGIAPIDRQQETVTRGPGRKSPMVQRELVVGVECIAAGTTTAVLDPLLVWAVRALIDSTLGGLASACEEAGTRWEAEAYDQDYRKATLLLRVLYPTSTHDPETGPTITGG